MPKLYYVSGLHRQNYLYLLSHFNAFHDREYAAACYVLAHPEIYRKVSWSRVEYPFDFLSWRGRNKVDLSSSFKGLVDMAANLFNPRNKFNLMESIAMWDEHLQMMFYSALDIRTGRISVHDMDLLQNKEAANA